MTLVTRLAKGLRSACRVLMGGLLLLLRKGDGGCSLVQPPGSVSKQSRLIHPRNKGGSGGNQGNRPVHSKTRVRSLKDCNVPPPSSLADNRIERRIPTVIATSHGEGRGTPGVSEQ
jgi:hypothetical protein